MASESEIIQRLKGIAASYAPAVSNIAKVKSVNVDQCTCVLIDDDGQEFFDVRLRPVTGKNKGYLPVPRRGSFVLAVRVEDSEDWAVVASEEIERMELIVGDMNVRITEDEIIINGGKLGGMVKISELTSRLNKLVSLFNSHTHQVNTSGSAVAQTGIATAPTSFAQMFKASDYEDINLKH